MMDGDDRDEGSLHVPFDESDWERTDRDWKAWLSGELDRPLLMMDGPSLTGLLRIGTWESRKRLGLRPYSFMDLAMKPLPAFFDLSVPAEEVVEEYGKVVSAIRPLGDSFPRWWPNFGPGIMAGFLGARVTPFPETVWFDSP
jgi:hypothetical protein